MARSIVRLKTLAGRPHASGAKRKGLELPPELVEYFTNGSCFTVRSTPTGLLFHYEGENVTEDVTPAPRPSWLPISEEVDSL